IKAIRHKYPINSDCSCAFATKESVLFQATRSTITTAQGHVAWGVPDESLRAGHRYGRAPDQCGACPRARQGQPQGPAGAANRGAEEEISRGRKGVSRRSR